MSHPITAVGIACTMSHPVTAVNSIYGMPQPVTALDEPDEILHTGVAVNFCVMPLSGW